MRYAPATLAPNPLPLVPQVDERAARRTLQGQLALLEEELASLVTSVWPRPLAVAPVGGGRAPRVLTRAALEELRDAMAGRVAEVRAELDARGAREERARATREHMLLEPERYGFVRISNADVGEPGCLDWHVRPRFGLLGMLMRWWRVRISSGCP